MPEDKKHLACTECREKKLRCEPGQDGKCVRCFRLEKRCHVPEVKRKQPKPKLRGRVDKLENSYAEILSLLKDTSRSGRVEQHVDPRDSVSTIADSLSQRHDLASVASNQSPNGQSIGQSPQGPQMDEMVESYRTASLAHFPFVLLPEECNTTTLFRDRPMLASAVIIVTSWTRPKFQAMILQQFFEELAQRYFVKGEKSLDLLQSILVVFGWCHWYSVSFNPQASRLMSLIVNMTIELGINQKPSNLTQHDMIVSSTFGLNGAKDTTPTEFWSYESRRVLVGAYIASTLGLLLNRKQFSLEYTDYLDESLSLLAAAPQFPSDIYLVHTVRAWRLAGEVSRTFDQGSRERVRELSDDKIKVLVQTLMRQLNDWRAGLPTTLAGEDELASVMTSRLNRHYDACCAYIHEVGLYGLLQGQQPSITRVSLVYDCYAAATKALSDFLNLQPQELVLWTSPDWRSFNLSIMLCVRSSIVLEYSYSNTEWSERASGLDGFLGNLCIRMKELLSFIQEPENHNNYLQTLLNEWTSVKSYHQSVIQRNIQRLSGVPEQANSNIQQSFPSQNGFLDFDVFNDMFWAGYTETQGAQAGFLPI